MSNEIVPDYSQQFLIPPSLEDWVPKNHPVHFISAFVDELDLESLGFKSDTCEDGSPNNSSNMLLKVWLYGYYEKIYSSRKLEKACKQAVTLIWLTGMRYPDHHTIRRFFNNNQKLLKDMFSLSVRVAIKVNLVNLVFHVVKGTKVFADVSKNRKAFRKDPKKLLTILDASLDEIFEIISTNEKLEIGDGGYSLPPEYQDPKKLNQLINEHLEELYRRE